MSERPIFKKRFDPAESLLRNNLRTVSSTLRQRLHEELEANAHNMESGVPLEDAFRDEFGNLLQPYSLDVGHIVDREGFTCGECDVVIVDQRRVPLLKRPSSDVSRRKHFAFESVYGIVEVKQTLTLGNLDLSKPHFEPGGSLWDACTKAFAFKQLARRKPTGVIWGSSHPISILFFYRSELDLSIDSNADRLVTELVVINALVPPEERVNALFVLDAASVGWWRPDSTDEHIFYRVPHAVDHATTALLGITRSGGDTLYELFDYLWTTLAGTQLAPPDFSRDYGVASIRERLRVVRPVVAQQVTPSEETT